MSWIKSLHGNPAGAVMLLETADRRLLIVKASYKKHWTPPGGVIDKGESPLRAALRETKEEVGLGIDQNKVQFAGVVYSYGEDVDVYRFIFHSKITDEQVESIVLQESEIEAYALETSEQIMKAERTYDQDVVIWATEESLPVYSEVPIRGLV